MIGLLGAFHSQPVLEACKEGLGLLRAAFAEQHNHAFDVRDGQHVVRRTKLCTDQVHEEVKVKWADLLTGAIHPESKQQERLMHGVPAGKHMIQFLLKCTPIGVVHINVHRSGYSAVLDVFGRSGDGRIFKER